MYIAAFSKETVLLTITMNHADGINSLASHGYVRDDDIVIVCIASAAR